MIFSADAPRCYRIIFSFIIVLLSACSARTNVVVVDDKSQSIYHTVIPGDTLFSIAWRYELDFVTLAKVNHLTPPYVIRSGQRIYLNAKSATATVPAIQTKTTKQKPSSTVAKTTKPSTTTKAAQTVGVVNWQWPSSGTIIGRFASQNGLNKGIDLDGKLGQPVMAAATGTVVYAGSGLLGYGQLIIVKHNDEYLSAYAHNSQLLVKENDQVVVGQKIAEMGATGTNRVKLHFEIRKAGKPVDPLNYLPSR